MKFFSWIHKQLLFWSVSAFLANHQILLLTSWTLSLSTILITSSRLQFFWVLSLPMKVSTIIPRNLSYSERDFRKSLKSFFKMLEVCFIDWRRACSCDINISLVEWFGYVAWSFWCLTLEGWIKAINLVFFVN